jgi:hypothetical protein
MLIPQSEEYRTMLGDAVLRPAQQAEAAKAARAPDDRAAWINRGLRAAKRPGWAAPGV